MIEHEYFGHWWKDGRKPYMVYSLTGGTSYISENVAFGGWSKREWTDDNCDSFFVNCAGSEPSQAVEQAEHNMAGQFHPQTQLNE